MTTQRWLLGLGILAGTSLSGCATHTGNGALAGTGIGAGIGALAGSAVGKPGAGAAIGAGVGALTGAAVGNSMDEQDKRHQQEIALASAQSRPAPMSIQDVVNMSKGGVSDQVIITQMRNSNSVFHLNSDDVVRLRQEGVSDNVVNAMMETPHRPVVVRQPRTVYVEPSPVYVVEPYPPPVSVGFGYHYGRRCW